MARFSRRGRRKPLSMPEVSLTPLIDTALTLLIIFMVTTPMIQNNIKIDLPKGNAREAGGAKQDLVVFVDKKGTIFLNGTQIVSEAVLMQELQKQVGRESQKTVFVKADEAVNYGRVIQIVDQIKVVGGVQYVALATKRVC